ncbi:MAG: hypothetical protein OIF50_05015 [Flavobacteriaceae bacterium]|nr:hypothetical protein [Flavobacteriaceae bacterium]
MEAKKNQKTENMQSVSEKKKRNNTTVKLENRIEKGRQFLASLDKFSAYKKTEAESVSELQEHFAHCEAMLKKHILSKSNKQRLVAHRQARFDSDQDGVNKSFTRINLYLHNKKGIPQHTIDLVAALIRITRNANKSKARKEEEKRLAADPMAVAALRRFTPHGSTYGNRLATLIYIVELLEGLGPVYNPNNANIKLPRLKKFQKELAKLSKEVNNAKDDYNVQLIDTSKSSKKLMVLCSKAKGVILSELAEDDPRHSILKRTEFV